MNAAQCKIARTLVSWSQRELAKRSGVSQPTIVKFEQGEWIREPLVKAMMFAFSQAGIQFVAAGIATGATRVELPDGSAVVYRPAR